MKQLHLPGMSGPPIPTIVNVASVPQRSPFRYPGGKTWFVPYARQWLSHLSTPLDEFIEPFAGGAIVGLTVAFEQRARHVTLVELDADVAAVWSTILDHEDGGRWLAGQIRDFHFSPENVENILRHEGGSLFERAFRTIVKNRVNRGGILAAGAGKVKHGENGKGLASRWYPVTLEKRIRDIASIRDRLSFVQGDALEVLRQHSDRPRTAYFIDPPYTTSGKRPGSRLYAHWEIDHEALFALASTLAGDFIMTYDNVPDVKSLADRRGLDTRTVAMKNTHHAQVTELVIGRDLTWLD